MVITKLFRSLLCLVLVSPWFTVYDTYPHPPPPPSLPPFNADNYVNLGDTGVANCEAKGYRTITNAVECAFAVQQFGATLGYSPEGYPFEYGPKYECMGVRTVILRLGGRPAFSMACLRPTRRVVVGHIVSVQSLSNHSPSTPPPPGLPPASPSNYLLNYGPGTCEHRVMAAYEVAPQITNDPSLVGYFGPQGGSLVLVLWASEPYGCIIVAEKQIPLSRWCGGS